MSKITLDELIEKDLLDIPDPDYEFMLSEAVGINTLGLRDSKGVYIIEDHSTGDIIYVGISKVLGKRLAQHKNKSCKGIIYKMIEAGLTPEQAEKKVELLKISIIKVEKESYRRILEKYLIEKHSPYYNIEGTDKERASAKKAILPINEIVFKYEKGYSINRLSTEYFVSFGTIKSRLIEAGVEIDSNRKPTVVSPSSNLPEKIIANAYEKGKSAKHLSKKYKVPVHVIRAVVTRAGVPIRKNKGRKQLPIDEIVERYKQGEPLTELAKEFKTSTGTLYSRIKELGIRPKQLKQAEIVRMRHKGHTLRAIAKEVGLSSSTVSTRLKKAGVR